MPISESPTGARTSSARLHRRAFLVTKWWPSGSSGPSRRRWSRRRSRRPRSAANQFDFPGRAREGESGSTYGVGLLRRSATGSASAALGISWLLARAGVCRLAEASSILRGALSTASGSNREHATASSTHRRQQREVLPVRPGGLELVPVRARRGAFAIATVFALRRPQVGAWVAYSTATLIGASRVALGRHFPSDVVASAIIGNSIGRMALTRWTAQGRSRSELHPDLRSQNKGSASPVAAPGRPPPSVERGPRVETSEDAAQRPSAARSRSDPAPGG